jgi:hypothetical protein
MIFATDEHRLRQIQCREFCSGGWVSRISETPQAARLPLQHPHYPRNPRLRLRFHCHLSLDRVGDEALVVRHVIHLLNLLGSRLLVT